jgi:predicted adenine nucleotide alpha hydrolase (AANH) superfamily ATPase
MASILLHCCCAPCATYTVRSLREQDLEVTALWYNPNVHPFTEHMKRFESMKSLAERTELSMIVDEGYDMSDYFRAVVGDEGNRCSDCYRMRLNKTAQMARENGFDAFTTTLLISPYQNQDMLHEIGEVAAQENEVEFLFRDLREGFAESQRMAKELDLYRQKYCGCIYSEWERYSKVKVG